MKTIQLPEQEQSIIENAFKWELPNNITKYDTTRPDLKGAMKIPFKKHILLPNGDIFMYETSNKKIIWQKMFNMFLEKPLSAIIEDYKKNKSGVTCIGV